MRIGIIILFPTLVGDCHVAMLLAMTVRVLLVMTVGVLLAMTVSVLLVMTVKVRYSQ